MADPSQAADPDDEDYQRFLIETAKTCRCCPMCWERPCASCCAGGICDNMRCTCDDDDRGDYDEPDSEEPQYAEKGAR